MRSRWTSFLTTDGEKPDTQSPTANSLTSPATALPLTEWLEWKKRLATRLFDALEPLCDQDLARTVTIRGEPHSVMQAINRQLAHYPHHVGQIVLLAKHCGGANWQSLSVPRNKSAEFNRKVAAGEASQR